MKQLVFIIFLGVAYTGYYFYLKNSSDNLENNDKVKKSKIKSKIISSFAPKKRTPLKKYKRPTPKKVSIKVKENKSFIPKRVQTPTPPKNLKYDDSYVPLDDDGNMVITEVFLDGQNVVVHGDLLVASLDEFNDNQMDKKPLIISKPRVWPNGKIPYEIASDVPEKSRIYDAIKYINQETYVTFQRRKGEEAYVYFKNGERNCYSYIGFIGRKQDISLSPHCRTKEILHEMTHTLGFFHEQSREDRDEYLEVNWRNIETKYQINFKKIPKHLTLTPDTKFDFESLMLYPPNSFALVHDEFTMVKKNGDAYEGNTQGKLSLTDIKKINLAYKLEVMKQ